MASVAEKVAGLYEAPSSFDPADVDALGDDTAARSRKRRFVGKLDVDAPDAGPAGPGSKKLRMRAEVPVLPQYKGKKVDRKAVFGGDVSEGDDGDGGASSEEFPSDLEDFPIGAGDGEDDGSEGEPAVVSGAGAGGFSISGDLEKEYERMMKSTQGELEVMRAPSQAELAKREEDGKRLKTQLDAWGALVEFRIHLEGALSLGHRLPVDQAHCAFRGADNALAKELAAVEGEVRELIGTLAAYQERVVVGRGVRPPRPSPPNGDGTEANAWEKLDGHLQPIMDWALGVADEWKERTRLDSRRSFKVLDQSLSAQMQAVAETDPEKLRKRCTPGPGTSQAGSTGSELDIFDDRDFYVPLLREVLAGGQGANGTAAEEARQLHAELQGRRSAKKRNQAEVERRASKGRKIRYVPIERLQNFMAPRPRVAVGGGDAAAAVLPVGGGSLGDGIGVSAAQPLRDQTVEAFMKSLFATGRGS